MTAWPAFCRDCLTEAVAGEIFFKGAPARADACPACGGTRILAHPELDNLSIAHIDCDAFYAAIEKRDDPALADKPLIVGGETRGVVSTACYIARRYGVRSAMPMFQARKLCPHAVILKPRHSHYSEVARQIREMMQALTPLVEPLSLDEAYLDLSGTEKMQGMSPARTLAALADRIEREVGITLIGQLQDMEARDLAARYGSTGLWLHRVSQAIDSRPVDPGGEMKGISSETTFHANLTRLADLEAVLWRQCERVSARAKAKGLAGRTVVLKLKTARFKLLTRSGSLDAPTQLADRIFRQAVAALKREADGTPFRLLGVGLTNLVDGAQADPGSLIDPESDKRAAAERAMDSIRAKFGGGAVGTGRGFRKP